jgi:hypothetical protein
MLIIKIRTDEGLQKLLFKPQNLGEEFDMKISITERKVMTFDARFSFDDSSGFVRGTKIFLTTTMLPYI